MTIRVLATYQCRDLGTTLYACRVADTWLMSYDGTVHFIMVIPMQGHPQRVYFCYLSVEIKMLLC